MPPRAPSGPPRAPVRPLRAPTRPLKVPSRHPRPLVKPPKTQARPPRPPAKPPKAPSRPYRAPQTALKALSKEFQLKGGTNRSHKGIKMASGSLALLSYFSHEVVFYLYQQKQGSGPRRGRSPVEKGEIPSVHIRHGTARDSGSARQRDSARFSWSGSRQR